MKVMSCLNGFQMLMIGSMGKFSDDKEKNTAFLIKHGANMRFQIGQVATKSLLNGLRVLTQNSITVVSVT